MADERQWRPGPKILTVVIRNPSPFIHMQEPPTHRTVRLVLTDEQRELLSMRWVGSSGKVQHFEEIASIIDEPVEEGE